MKIALVSCSSMSDYKTDIPNEDELLLSYLQQKAVDAEIVIWDDELVDWESYDIVVIKSTWDYFNKPMQFRAWLHGMQQREIRMFNSPETILWNIDKSYLKDLEKAGIPTIPTIWLDQNMQTDLPVVMSQLGASEIIIKPRISGASKNTFKVNAHNIVAVQQQFDELIKEEDFMAQPFVPQIMEGEYSFIFFNGLFSHAVKKAPQKDDFRVQHYFGGSITPYIPTDEIKSQAENVANQFAADCLYARVDGILINGILHIIELEVIEPMLYLHFHADSYNNMLMAIRERKKQVAILA
jgi:glutathione synthase/RimK-type ligase-like ATP-grasp enzyme